MTITLCFYPQYNQFSAKVMRQRTGSEKSVHSYNTFAVRFLRKICVKYKRQLSTPMMMMLSHSVLSILIAFDAAGQGMR